MGEGNKTKHQPSSHIFVILIIANLDRLIGLFICAIGIQYKKQYNIAHKSNKSNVYAVQSSIFTTNRPTSPHVG